MAKHKTGELRCPATALISIKLSIMEPSTTFLRLVMETWREMKLIQSTKINQSFSTIVGLVVSPVYIEAYQRLAFFFMKIWWQLSWDF